MAINIQPTPEDFQHGDRVRYMPNHVKNDVHHPDCEDGVVSSTNEHWVFVKYDNAVMKMVTGDEPYTAKATDVCNLILKTTKSYDQFETRRRAKS